MRIDRGVVLLGVGAGVGIVVAAAGLVESRASGALPAGAVARVNGVVVRADDYERSVRALERDRPDGVGDTERRHVLDRMIDEELLVQRALDLGLARQDARVRRDLVASVIDSVVAEHDDVKPSDAELEAFYEREREFFSRPGRLWVREIWCRADTPADAPAAEERARRAAARLRAGEGSIVVRDALGDRELAAPPDGLVPPAKLLDYLGPTVLRAALALEAGGVSEPVRSATGYHVVQVVEREASWLPPRAEVGEEVLAEYRRRNGDRALRAYLDELRARSEIVLR